MGCLILAVFPDRDSAHAAINEMRLAGFGSAVPRPIEELGSAILPPPPRAGEYEPRHTLAGVGGSGERLAWKVPDHRVGEATRVIEAHHGIAEVLPMRQRAQRR